MEPLTADTPDVELVACLKAGHQKALGILYDRYAALVFTVAMQILGRRDEAEDLVHEVFLTFWKQDKYNPNRGGLSTYLSLLTRSRALNKLGSRESQQRVTNRLQSAESPEFDAATPLELAAQDEQQVRVRAALAQLVPSQQQVLELAYYKGLSQSQIAAQLNLPLGTVKTQARQGLLKLRQILNGSVEPGAVR